MPQSNEPNEEQPKPVGQGMIEVDQHALSKGEVTHVGKDNFKFRYPTPRILKAWTDGIVYFCAGLSGIVGATDLLSGYQAKVMMLVLSVTVLGCGAIQKGVGVKPSENEKN